MSQKAITALVFMIAGLLAVTVLVGLAQRILDVTGVAVALSSVLTGIVAGLVFKSKSPPPGDGDKP